MKPDPNGWIAKECAVLGIKRADVFAVAVYDLDAGAFHDLWVPHVAPTDARPLSERVLGGRRTELGSEAPARRAVYCGGDRCTGLWNLACDDPAHPRARPR